MLPTMRFWRWLKRRVSTFDYFWDYIEAAYGHFNDIFWGVAVTGVIFAIPFGIYAVVSQFKQPPSWLNWLAVISAVLLAGYYVWRADHVRLIRRLSISRVIPQTWRDARGECIAYYLEVLNESEGDTVCKITAAFNAIEPPVQNLGWLPVLLWQKHDNPIPGIPHIPAREFHLNPRGIKHIDFVSSWQGHNHFTVHQIAVPNIHVPIAQGFNYRLQVVITAENMPSISQWFEVWMNEEDILQCKMERR